MASAPARKIIHIDMDAFYASVEQRDDPSLRGRSRSQARPVDSADNQREVSLALVRATFPPEKGIRLVGVTVSNFAVADRAAEELPLPLSTVK